MYTALALSFRGPTIYERPIVCNDISSYTFSGSIAECNVAAECTVHCSSFLNVQLK